MTWKLCVATKRFFFQGFSQQQILLEGHTEVKLCMIHQIFCEFSLKVDVLQKFHKYTLVKTFLRVTFFKPNWADIYGTDWDMVL